ncbi:MAG: hypothetical protein R3F59_10820 [Myxococcota bacterium]
MDEPITIEADGRRLELAGAVEYDADCVRITAEPDLLDALTFALLGTYDAICVQWGARRVLFEPATVEFELGAPVVELRQA